MLPRGGGTVLEGHGIGKVENHCGKCTRHWSHCGSVGRDWIGYLVMTHLPVDKKLHIEFELDFLVCTVRSLEAEGPRVSPRLQWLWFVEV